MDCIGLMECLCPMWPHRLSRRINQISSANCVTQPKTNLAN